MTTNPTRNPTWISDWRPEDEAFWNAGGKVIARRNLIWSIVAEHIGFSVWLIWSIVTTKLPQAGFHYTTDQLFQLVAVPGLIGALMRFPYTFAVTTFGGRNWTIFSAAILFIPTLSLAYFVSQPDTPFWLMLLIASTAGLGGGNFASSMTNISFFFPDRMKGWALGLNAAGGNIGVSSVQLLTPILMTLAVINLFQASPVDGIFLQNAGLMWVLPIAIAVFGAVFFMNNLTTAKASIKNQLAVVKRKHTWIMAYLYIGTFGSFIGYSAAFPLLIKTQFPAISISIAFLGPLVGSLSRPLGGLLADKIGGSILTFWNFIAMAAATVGVLYFVGHKDFTGFLAMFLILFVTTGIGNGSTYRMIPSIFREQNLFRVRGKGDAARAAALKTASIESGAAVGFIGAIGAVGGYLIPTGFGKSIAMTGGPSLALAIYLAFYASCLGLTWWFYLRRSPQGEGASSLAKARV
ncbi:MFS transporter [Bradyrhizobium japonicum]|uniref:MFS transporter n=1 Tax=Bradyrhizobium japonicum TaxID=375 RepID=UPI00209D7C0E|nr:MFS transporter [Bradyrhizobium japonicum]MCP1768076.1 NNP family nitrate/nitrite transporter-like MFS transporter [Bradyrhizobium japonicum]MCP1790218.1 NNP family nitrate/nitrite transporter-like MFS transporter [Bradyrhizobium japonicum]MCP1802715.1 NNP family nitrate/nitrite transporter-like MFS transporter [Bradyrhizobium japonicum]MCP1811653.1 NNP family nitrate/nitrite transporter-like MFS transporter [Bradyrhizobium japonicum]MCP1867468.1 NNP family nitrate/nitrite transporter-like 